MEVNTRWSPSDPKANQLDLYMAEPLALSFLRHEYATDLGINV